MIKRRKWLILKRAKPMCLPAGTRRSDDSSDDSDTDDVDVATRSDFIENAVKVWCYPQTTAV